MSHGPGLSKRPAFKVCLNSDEARENVDISFKFAYDLGSQYK